MERLLLLRTLQENASETETTGYRGRGPLGRRAGQAQCQYPNGPAAADREWSPAHGPRFRRARQSVWNHCHWRRPERRHRVRDDASEWRMERNRAAQP